jgi:hypothetical protein
MACTGKCEHSPSSALYRWGTERSLAQANARKSQKFQQRSGECERGGRHVAPRSPGCVFHFPRGILGSVHGAFLPPRATRACRREPRPPAPDGGVLRWPRCLSVAYRGSHMTDVQNPFSDLDLQPAIDLRWTLRDIKAKRWVLSPINPAHLQ